MAKDTESLVKRLYQLMNEKYEIKLIEGKKICRTPSDKYLSEEHSEKILSTLLVVGNIEQIEALKSLEILTISKELFR